MTMLSKTLPKISLPASTPIHKGAPVCKDTKSELPRFKWKINDNNVLYIFYNKRTTELIFQQLILPH